MEATMTDKIQILMAAALAALGLNTLIPAPAFATDGAHPALLGAAIGPNGYPVAPRLEPRLAPARVQIADSVQSTTSASSSASASASASSSVSVSGGKQGKCTAEANARAKANDVEDSDHDLKVVEGSGCSAKAESSATVKPQKQQSE
ncbi:MAG: hypothetical protein C0484_27400 [Rhodospirillum sp.]|nr:hypothetical protein [Rhodospirillum sp.]